MLMQVFYLYEFRNDDTKQFSELGYGVIFPNDKTIYNKYSTGEVLVYNFIDEFKDIHCQGNRQLIFLNMIDAKLLLYQLNHHK